MEKISIIVPCYNDEKNIENLHRELKNSLEGHDYSYEIIFVDDGCHDKTFDKVKEIINKNNDTKFSYLGIQLSKNFGQHHAIWAGLHSSTGHIVSIISSDLQEHPKNIIPMVKLLNENVDHVYGIRQNYKTTFIKKMGSVIFWNFINFVSNLDFDRRQVAFRVMSRRFLDTALNFGDKNLFIHGIFLSIGFESVKYPFELQKRNYSKSGWTIKKSIELAINAISTFSIQPLRLGILLGFITGSFSLLFTLYIILRKVFFSFEIPGYASIVAIIGFLFGLQFILLGVIGEYIGKVYTQTLNRPTFIIKERYLVKRELGD